MTRRATAHVRPLSVDYVTPVVSRTAESTGPAHPKKAAITSTWGRRLQTEAILEKVEVLGVQSVTIHPTPEADAHGWSHAFGTLPLLLNAGRAFSTDGRGERSRADTIRVIVRFAARHPQRVDTEAR